MEHAWVGERSCPRQGYWNHPHLTTRGETLNYQYLSQRRASGTGRAVPYCGTLNESPAFPGITWPSLLHSAQWRWCLTLTSKLQWCRRNMLLSRYGLYRVCTLLSRLLHTNHVDIYVLKYSLHPCCKWCQFMQQHVILWFDTTYDVLFPDAWNDLGWEDKETLGYNSKWSGKKQLHGEQRTRQHGTNSGAQ